MKRCHKMTASCDIPFASGLMLDETKIVLLATQLPLHDALLADMYLKLRPMHTSVDVFQCASYSFSNFP